MKLTIRRTLSARARISILPDGFNAGLLPIITSNHPLTTLNNPDLVAAKANWPLATVVDYDPAINNVSLTPGIRMMSPAAGGGFTNPTYSIKTANLSLAEGVMANIGRSMDITGAFIGPAGSSIQGPILSDSELVGINFQHNLSFSNSYGYPAGNLNASNSGNQLSLTSVYTRGTHRLFPYVQTNSILPDISLQAFKNIVAFDTNALATTLQSRAANTLAASLLATNQYQGAECMYVELDIDGDLLTRGQNADTDSYLFIPLSAGGAYAAIWDSQFSFVDQIPVTAANYFGAQGALIVPLAALRNGNVSQVMTPIHTLPAAEYLAAGVFTKCAIGFIGQIDVSLVG